MGLATGAAIYAVLRRRGLPWWGATLPALPVLFDVFEMQIEHMVMSDALFVFLVTVALAVLCWSDRPPFLLCAVAGLMIGYASVVRTVGEPLLVVLVVGLLLRRVDWKRTAVLLVAGVLPIAGYMVWFHGSYGQYALDTSSGTFLYSRVSTFAKCSQITLPASLKVLCDPAPPAQRPNSQEYLWSVSTPLYKLSKGNSSRRLPTAWRANSPGPRSSPSRWRTPGPCSATPRTRSSGTAASQTYRLRAVVPVRAGGGAGDDR